MVIAKKNLWFYKMECMPTLGVTAPVDFASVIKNLVIQWVCPSKSLKPAVLT